MIKVENLSFKVENKQILKNINVEFKKNVFTGIIGANGSGKSTLLKNVYRILKPTSGKIYVEDKNFHKMSDLNAARKLSVVAQEESISFDFKVSEIVKMGLYSRKDKTDFEEREEVIRCLKKTGMEDFYERSFLSLSGGEKQRVMISRALAQNTEIMILDEPTNHLDIGYRMKMMDIIKKENKTIIAALHDINIAAEYCDEIVLIDGGEIIKRGTPEEIIDAETLKNIFKVNAFIDKNPITNKMRITYLPNDMKLPSEI